MEMEFICTDRHNKRVEQTEYRDEGVDTATRLGQVLTDEEMVEIWSDLARISTPTWVTPIPLDLGSSSHGKLKADQWRTLGITHLTLSLIRLWGLRESRDARSQKCKELLDVTISLMSAVILASSRVTSPSIAAAYLTHMKSYMEGIKKLFPQYRFRPNHHMALHLHEYLCRFGPVHSWWTFPFERIIGMLQHIPTNFKIGMSCALFVDKSAHSCFSSRPTGANDIRKLYSVRKSAGLYLQDETVPSCNPCLSIHLPPPC